MGQLKVKLEDISNQYWIREILNIELIGSILSMYRCTLSEILNIWEIFVICLYVFTSNNPTFARNKFTQSLLTVFLSWTL